MDWTVNKIRDTFLAYFESKGHAIEPSAPMVIKNDPTLMFTNAGMNQFKDIFLGHKDPDLKRIVNSQKCLRVSGKHNDLEEVGVDTYHHTMFEMLGNWSFGDYFKKEAIQWAWELLVDVYKLDKDRLYVTVFEGDVDDNTQPDIESEEIWQKFISKDRVLRCSKKDNFWEMGDVGPCGPCSEIHIDLRSNADRKKIDGKSLVNKDHNQVIEIWNLVFVQFNRNLKGELSDLPKKHVDTGMGLERVAMALQQKKSNYDTDIFAPLIEKIESLCNHNYSATDSKIDIAFRVIADHIRAVSFSIADGQLPSNNAAGYVIRRILRRALRYGYSFLDMKSPFMFKLLPTLINQLGEHFTELKLQENLISSVVKEEEESFLKTLSKGILRLNRALENVSIVSGKVAFELFDTYGFPIDLTQLIADENGISVDMDSFHQELENQKNRSRNSNTLTTDDWIVLHEDSHQEFIGYDILESVSKVLRYRSVDLKGKKQFQIVLDKIPFYPEGGGQVGDTGLLIQSDTKTNVIDTKKENDLSIITVKSIEFDVNLPVVAKVNTTARKLTQANHTATHLLHYVLRKKLGTHIEQKGSFVSPKHLRFDFSHFQKISDKDLKLIESEINNLIFKAIPLVENRGATLSEANAIGAMMLFGEKYGNKVRIISFDDSIELCGGTHVQNTSELSVFKTLSESSVASGIRRIEAITSTEAINCLNAQENELVEIKTLLKNTTNVSKSIQQLIDSEEKLAAQLLEINQKRAKELKNSILSSFEEVNGIECYFGTTELNASLIKDILFQLKANHSNVIIGIASCNDKKLTFSLLIAESVVANYGLKANEAIKLIAPTINGGGGGQVFFATAGGKNIDGIPKAINQLKDWIAL